MNPFLKAKGCFATWGVNSYDVFYYDGTAGTARYVFCYKFPDSYKEESLEPPKYLDLETGEYVPPTWEVYPFEVKDINGAKVAFLITSVESRLDTIPYDISLVPERILRIFA